MKSIQGDEEMIVSSQRPRLSRFARDLFVCVAMLSTSVSCTSGFSSQQLSSALSNSLSKSPSRLTASSFSSQGSTTCVYVNDAAGSPASTFCNAGGAGAACRGDQVNTTAAQVCQNESGNPLASAIAFAKGNGLYNLTSDSGAITFDSTTKLQNNWHVGAWIPSGLSFIGSQVAQTTFQPADSLSRFDVVVFVGASDQAGQPLAKSIYLQSLMIDGKGKANVGLDAGGTEGGVNFVYVGVQNTLSSGMVLGMNWGGSNPQSPELNWIEGFNGTSQSNPNSIIGCYISNVGNDGLMVVGGNHVAIKGCQVQTNTPNVSGNGMGTFLGANDVLFANNTISGFTTGIGLDGSYPASACNGLFGQTGGDSLLSWNGCLANAGINKSNGYNTNITVQSNSIYVPALLSSSGGGIALWRTRTSLISGNYIQGTAQGYSGSQVGIMLNESDNNTVLGNTSQNLGYGIILQSTGFSGGDGNVGLWGSSYNDIGAQFSGPTVIKGQSNYFKYNGVALAINDSTHALVRNNRFIYNDFSGSLTACNLSASGTSWYTGQRASQNQGAGCNWDGTNTSIVSPAN